MAKGKRHFGRREREREIQRRGQERRAREKEGTERKLTEKDKQGGERDRQAHERYRQKRRRKETDKQNRERERGGGQFFITQVFLGCCIFLSFALLSDFSFDLLRERLTDRQRVREETQTASERERFV